MFGRVLRSVGHVLPKTQRHLSFPSHQFSVTSARFAGHNKWSKIKHRKGLEDAKKSKIYGKAAREVASAAKTGGSTNPEENSLLAATIRRARDAGVPKENIENTLARVERNKSHGQAMLFEALYNGSVGLLIECRSDNVNRTVKQVKDLLSYYRARSAPVKFMFQQRGYVKVRIGDDMETLLDRVMNVCSIDFAEWQEESESGQQRGVELVCAPEELSKAMKAIADVSSTSPLCEVLVSEVNWAPLESQEAEDTEMDGLDSLMEALEVNDDVERVYTTLEPNHLIVDVS